MKLKKFLRAFDARHRALWNYRELRKTIPLREHTILLEPQQGRSFCGNIYYIAKEIVTNPSYSHMRVYVVSESKSTQEILNLMSRIGLSESALVIRDSKEYVELLASAKYLITDTGFAAYYVKREGQVLWNTWHGTPLKAMGRKDVSNPQGLGNMQKNFALADYLSYPNKYTAKHMIEDYMLPNICSATVLYSEYPRNEVLADSVQRDAIRSQFDIEDKTVFAYMPTWRSYPGYSKKESGYEIQGILAQMDCRLNDGELMYVSLHPLQKAEVDFTHFKRVRLMPDMVETYEFLSACDALVTDYSSVLFDYALTDRKLVLFAYDEDLYFATRGTYLSLDDLPFPKVNNLSDLFLELRSDIAYSTREFKETFCPYEAEGATRRLCARVLSETPHPALEEDQVRGNGRDNVLIYTGNLAKNGITVSLMNLVRSLDTSKRNYFLTFGARRVRGGIDFLNQLPDDISYIPSVGKNNLTFKEKVVQYSYAKGRVGFDTFKRVLEGAYTENLNRHYGFTRFSSVIQFTGYDYKRIFQFSLFPCRRIIMAHNNMIDEAKLKGNSRPELLHYAYSTYDVVAVVSEDLRESVRELSGGKANVAHVPNLFDYRRVLDLSKEPLAFDDSTESTIPLDELQELLDSRNTVLISIGRFSPEKQHMMLISAFDRLCATRGNVHLVIVGGYSWKDTYEKTREFAESLKCSENVHLVKGMSNPYSLLAKTDGLILPSMYEGFGLVLIEADALGVPVVSTDICGPSTFMREHGGYLVENSEEGVLEGLLALSNGSVSPMNVDYEAYNNEALSAFEALFA